MEEGILLKKKYKENQYIHNQKTPDNFEMGDFSLNLNTLANSNNQGQFSACPEDPKTNLHNCHGFFSCRCTCDAVT